MGIHAGALAAFKLRSIAPVSASHGSTRAGWGLFPQTKDGKRIPFPRT